MIRRKGFLLAFVLLGLALFSLSAFNVNDTYAAVNLDGFVLTSDTYSLLSSMDFSVYTGIGANYSWHTSGFSWSYQDSTDIYGISALRTNQSYDVEEGNVYKMSVSFFYRDPRGTKVSPAALLQTVNSNDQFKTLYVEPVYCEVGEFSAIANSTIYNYNYSCVFDIYVQAKTSGNMPIYVGLAVNSSTMWFYPAMSYGIIRMSQDISIFTPNDAAREMNEKDDEDRDNLEQQSSDTESGADDSQQEAESTGTTLLSAFTSFVGALSSASPSNCRLNMDLGNFDMGVVDLCTLSPPSQFQSIASIMLILFCVPLSIATARKVISLFRSFQ